jgi:lipopolysaccharide transport system permease protein
LLGVYAIVYVVILRVRLPQFSSTEYIFLIFCGLIPFLGFSEGLGSGVPSVVANASLIRNTMFPIDLIPVKAVLVAQSTQVVGMVLLVAASAALGKLTPWVLLIVPIWICQILLTCGLMWILSTLNVFFRDLQTFIPIVILALMLISPIQYTVDMVPSQLRPLMAMNPLFHIIISYQSVLLEGVFPTQTFPVLLVVSVIVFSLGHRLFTRLKTTFSDHV